MVVAITPQNIVQGLPLLQWRGLEPPPYDMAPVDVKHSQAERKFPYIDGAGHDNTGRDPLNLDFRLFFINTLAIRSGTRLFPDLFEAWKDALLDGSSGDLRHPIMGPIRARVSSFDIEVDANKSLAGAIINVTFIETLDNPADQIQFQPLENNITELAVAADSALSDAGIVFPEGGPSNLASFLQQLEGLAVSAAFVANGLVNQGLGLIEQLIDTIDAVNSVDVFAARDVLTQLYSGLLDAQEKIGAGTSRRTTVISLPFTTTLSDVANDNSQNTVEDLMGLNTALLRSPSIPANTAIKIYTE